MDAKKFLAACGGDYEGTMRRLLGNEMLFCRLIPKVFQDEDFQKLETLSRQMEAGGTTK